MRVKKILTAVAVSLILMIIVMGYSYSFEISVITVSNVLFTVGMLYFFPGIIVLSGSTEIYRRFGYSCNRAFRKKPFNSYDEYNHHKQTRRVNGKGEVISLLGGFYILLSFGVTMF